MIKGRFTNIALSSFIFFVLLIMGCNKSEDIIDPPPVASGPTLSGINISGDNTLVTIEFSEGVYKGGVLNMPLTNDDLLITLNGGTAVLDSFRLSHTAGQNTAGIRLFLKGIANGSDILTVKPSGPQKIVNQAAVPMKETEQLTISLSDIGIIGNWVSTGENLSPVYQQFGFDSVYMQYRADGTYIFESFTIGGIHNTLSGTYSQSLSSVAGIRQIMLTQLLPVPATISGIFSLQGDLPVIMNYETVQTEPAVAGLTPPTPEGGFGSSGLLGSDNIQVFLNVVAE
jgi:hypothetical protein